MSNNSNEPLDYECCDEHEVSYMGACGLCLTEEINEMLAEPKAISLVDKDFLKAVLSFIPAPATSSDASELAKDDLLKNIESALEHGNESHCFVSTSLLVQLQNLIVDQKYTITRLENERDELVDTLSELHNLMEDTISGEYKPDSFTCQPARIILAKYQSVKGSDSKNQPAPTGANPIQENDHDA
jgi:transposase